MTTPEQHAMQRLRAGDHDDPHHILGAHPAPEGRGVVVRAYHPDATGVECLLGKKAEPMERVEEGLFACTLPKAKFPVRYRLRFHFADGATWERGDPYRFPPTLGDMDLHLFNEGTHRRLWDKLGANPATHDGETGTVFAVWAPNARRVSVVGDWCGWDGRLFPMRRLGNSGVWELFVPGIGHGALYKFEILTREGVPRTKTDPFAAAMEMPPESASVVYTSSHDWKDDDWMQSRPSRDHAREPMLIYEVHPGSWARVPEEGDRYLTYRELAERLVAHVKRLGFTHIELLPISEHPFYGSWGYQVSGYFAPSARYGSPDDFRYFVDHCHQHGIGVILDWVPAHFPKDDFALRRFDGTAVYEHEDPRQGEHPDWGTLIFNYSRTEVRNFLIANALYWLDEYHVDGLRVDAVASMLYLDYSRREGEWVPNRLGGRENLDAISFLQQMNEMVNAETPGCFTVAEESTSWPGVTHAVRDGGLGFTFKWNMGWMHDTLSFFALDPVHRKFHHDQLTFAMMYEHSERFIMPLSHDEVVHLKGSLLEKMAGDLWQKFANLRLLYAYQMTRPGKALLFMGSELAPYREWNHDQSLDWHLTNDPVRGALLQMFEDLGKIYADHPSLWRGDPVPEGFRWISVNDRENSVLAYERRDGDAHLVIALNLTPVPRDGYRIGAPQGGTYRQLMCTDDERYGGSAYPTNERITTDPSPLHGYEQSMELRLPPLSAVILAPEPTSARAAR
jgi:1,4-alpha-glucan branching enzyme